MKVSTRGEYGVRAMVALARNYGEGPMSIAVMAKESSIPPAYLEQLIVPLRKAGLVESKRGVQGGYQLTRSPDRVVVGEIYRVMEGPVAPMDCVSEDLSEQTCPLIDGCETRPVWLKVRDSIVQALDSMTLADLIKDRPERRQPRPTAAAAGSNPL
ncbi:MAG TPA: Rrf2 family transcriptional regulator [Thermomicrobiales bacterium]|nr:Rrf2 family transcriptional regulator [Thermomicrobiales bacterium]